MRNQAFVRPHKHRRAHTYAHQQTNVIRSQLWKGTEATKTETELVQGLEEIV